MADLQSVRIKADTTQVAKASKDLDRLSRSGTRAGSSLTKYESQTDKAKRATKGLGNELNVLRNAFASLGVALVVREMAQMTMQMQSMQNVLKVATGSAAGAAAEMEFLRKEADRLGFNLQVVGKQFGQFAAAAKGTALEGQAARDVFIGVAEASRALGLSSEQTEGALNALQQMVSKGNVQAEELRGQLGERIPGAFNMAARAMGVTTQELNKMLEQGEVLAEDLLPKLAVELSNTFGQGAQDAASGLAAEIGRFQTQMFELGAGVGTELLPEMTAFVRLLTDLLRIAADNTEVIGNLVRILGLLVAMNLVGWATRGAVALGQLALGMRGAAAGATLLSRGLTLLGGPAGIIFGVGAATLMLTSRFDESNRSAIDYAGGIDSLRQKFDDLGESQRELMRLELSDELRKEQQRFADLERQIGMVTQDLFNLSLQGGGVDPITGQSAEGLERQLVELNATAEQSTDRMAELERFLAETAQSADDMAGGTQAAAAAVRELTDAEKNLAQARGQFNQVMQTAMEDLANERALTAALAENEEAYRELAAQQRINAIVQQEMNKLAEAGATNLEQEAQALRQVLQLQLQQAQQQEQIRAGRTREQQAASDLDSLRQSLTQITPAAQEYADSIQVITTALEAGVINQGEFDALLAQTKDRFNDATAQASPFEDAWGSAMSSLESAFTDFLMNGMDDFDSFADSVMAITKRLVAEIITEFAKAQIGKALGSVIGGGSGGGSIGGQVIGSVAGEGLKNLLGFGAPAAAAAPAASAFAAPSIPLFGGATSIAGAGTAAASGGLMSGLAAAAGPIALGIGAFALLGGLFGGSRKRQQEKAQRDQILAREEELKVQLASIDGLEDLTVQRQRELDKLSPANREIQERVYALEDEIRITRERRSLEERAFRLIGDTASLRRRELARTEEANRGILRYIYAVEDAQERVAAAQDRVSQAEQRVTRAFDAVRRAVEAQEADLFEQRRAIEERQQELDQQFSMRIDMLDAALDRMRSNLGSAMSPFAERAMAKAVLDVVLASGINAVDEDTLRQALDVVASPSEELFATFQDYAREFVRTQNTLEAIKADAEQSLSVEERLAAEQIAKIDEQIDLGRQQLEAAQRQVDAAFGIDNSVKSIEEAMRGLTAAIGGLASARGGLSSAESALASLISRGPPAGAPISSGAAPAPSGANVGKLQAAGQLASRGPLALGEENTWTSAERAQLREVGLNLGSRSYASRSQIQALRDKVTAAGGTPAFADGGLHMGGMRLVGERGPELEATGPSRILSNRDLMSAIGGGGSQESLESIRSEIRGLRSELARTQYKIERNTRRTSDTLTIWDADGLPAERT